MKRATIVSLLVASCSQPALAQSYGTYGQQTPDYPQDTAPFPPGPVIGDGSNSRGGTMPVAALAPSDPGASDSTTGWIISDGNVVAPTGSEAKFRTLCNVGFVGKFDPIRGPGVKPYGHLHEFFGKTGMDQNTTYNTLRTNPSVVSTCAGGKFNSTLYWFPTPVMANAMGDGITRAKKANQVVVYYEAQYADNNTLQPFKPGMNMVFGVNMDDPADALVTAEIATANAKGGAAGYQRVGATVDPVYGNGFRGWICESSGETHKYLANADGSDAFTASGGTAGTCPTSSHIYAELISPGCWDGKNLSSTGGYKHMRHELGEGNSARTNICPTGWYHVVKIRVKIMFSHQGDYRFWRLSSDDAAATACGCVIRNGESMHTDWMNGWHDTTMQTFQHNCNGIEGFTGHECDSSSISTTQRLVGGIAGENAPDSSRTPQVVTSNNFTGASAGDWFDIPVDSSGFRSRAKLHKR